MAEKPYTFSAAEVAVMVLKAPDQFNAPPNLLLADSKLSEGDLARAQQQLAEKGYLLPAPDPNQEMFLAPALYTLLKTLSHPLMLAMMQIQRPNAPHQRVTVSWTPLQLLCNWVDEGGNHTFQPVSSLDELATFMLQQSGVVGFFAPEAAELGDAEATLEAADPRVIFVVVTHLGSPQQNPVALSWGISHQMLWLLTPSSREQTVTISPASEAVIHQKIVALIQSAIQESAQAYL